MSAAADHVLDAIDGALGDWRVSQDAMRWHPDAGEAEARSRHSADFSVAMLLPGPPASGRVEAFRSTSSVLRDLCETVTVGQIIVMNGCRWRVSDKRVNHDSYVLELDPPPAAAPVPFEVTFSEEPPGPPGLYWVEC